MSIPGRRESRKALCASPCAPEIMKSSTSPGTTHRLRRFRSRTDRSGSVAQFHPRRRMIAGFVPPAHGPIHVRRHEAAGDCRIEQQMINAQAGIPAVGVAKIIPERIDLRVRMQCSYRIGPSLFRQARKRLADFNSEEGVIDPSFGFVYVTLGGDDVVVTCENHWRRTVDELGRVRNET